MKAVLTVKESEKERNKGGYTASLVADRWAWAVNLREGLCDRQTDGTSNQSTDGPTDNGLQNRVSATENRLLGRNE